MRIWRRQWHPTPVLLPGKSHGEVTWQYLANNEKIEREIKEIIPFTNETKIIKYLGIYLPKETKDLYMLCYAKSLQLCPILCDPIDGSLPGSPVPGILQARTLDWVAISFSNA